MLDRVAGAVAQCAGRSVCRTLDRHAPAPAIKSNGVFLYGRCRFCTLIIVRANRCSWRAAHAVDEAYLAEMRDISH
ncbi:hypothetical protein [Novosphingobium sp. PASSN1]|uniref:hypothetical protein n=1 Tax=Novosphingobium sp. PASSN1 TaxID=2015561 RepID=UPI000BD80E87|nr:hypothetical protein [Novosphingobium sp. PASSN1]OYU37020.1 MAG: hypothetical protein CFE35_01135 [Novosphingobium sp. PASSN1]